MSQPRDVAFLAHTVALVDKVVNVPESALQNLMRGS